MVGDKYMKVYVVQKGFYSDRHVVAVTLDSDKADQFAELYARGHDDTEIEVYDTDDYDTQLALSQQNLKPYYIWYYKDMSTKISAVDWEMVDLDNLPILENHGHCYIAKMLARDEEHAKKIANDIVAEYKYRVEVEGIPDESV